MAAKLILKDGKLLLTSGLNPVPKVTPDTGALDNSCCCLCPDCCEYTAPVPDLVLTFESTDCPAVDGLTLNLIIDDPLSPPSDTNCWRGTLSLPVGGDSECFQGEYILCCCDGTSFCLSINPSIAAGCIPSDLSIVDIEECSCDPLDLLFRTTVAEIIFGECHCCTVGDEIFFRITE